MKKEPNLNTKPEKPALPEYRAMHVAEINRQAEVERSRLLTRGSGQSLEYGETRREAERAVGDNAADFTGFPMLAAEDSAAQGAGRPARSVLVVANDILARVAAITPVAAEIRRIRLTAVYQVEGAQSHGDVDAIMEGLIWPE